MKRLVTSFLGAALVLSIGATLAGAANKYPPGPIYRSCPDTLTIFQATNPDTIANPCYPVVSDTVLGLRGIFVGADVRASAYGFHIVTPGGGQFSGIQAFTGATNYVGSVPGTPTGGNLVLGDELVVYGTMQEFPAANGFTEIEGPDVVQGTNDIIVRRISTGNAVPINIVTTSDVHWLPAFSQGELWEGSLVRIRGPLKVGRTAIGPGVQTGNYLLTTVAPSTDSVLVDNFTLSPTLGGPAPPLNTVVDSVQGIISQNTAGGVNSYRLQLRDANDIFLAVPPNLSDAYPIEDNQIRLVFDRNVDETTAETESNYSLASEIDGTTIDDATMPTVPGNVVILTITSVRVDGDLETVGVLGVGSAGCPSCVISPQQQRSFVNGVLNCVDLQAPDPANLSIFDDRSRFAGAGALPGTKLTFRGTAVHQYGSLVYVVDESGATRGGVSVFGPTTTLVPGKRYRITGQVQEFQGESEIVSTALITDEGAGTIPAPTVQSVAALDDTTTDASGTPADPDGAILTGEDFECMLVRVEDVHVAEILTNSNFLVSGPLPASPDTILISNLSNAITGYVVPPVYSRVNVTGVLHFTNGTFRICPRGPSDITSATTSVGDGTGMDRVEFAVAPNPARTASITFGLPRRDHVSLGIYDLQGRQLVELANGNLPAGKYTRKWNGEDASGNRVSPGVYFYRLKVGAEEQTLRGVLLQ